MTRCLDSEEIFVIHAIDTLKMEFTFFENLHFFPIRVGNISKTKIVTSVQFPVY